MIPDAEFKNGALVTANLGLILLIHQIYDWQRPSTDLAKVWLWVATSFLLLSILVGFLSFFARIKISAFEYWISSDTDSMNPVYFGHLAKMSKVDLLSQLGVSEKAEVDSVWLHHLVTQIIINAKITQKKFTLFNTSLALTASALLTPVGFLIIYWGFCDEKL